VFWNFLIAEFYVILDIQLSFKVLYMKKIITVLFVSFVLILTARPCFSAEASLDSMIGQMIITGFKGNSVHSRGFKEVLKYLEEGKISGVIFFEDNIKNAKNLSEMTEAIYKTNSAMRPFISIDMEGGKVQRLTSKNGGADYPSAYTMASYYDTKGAFDVYSNMAYTLKKYLFNLNFAPCVDLDLNKKSILHAKERSYSDDSKKVTSYADEFIKAHTDKGIATALKHFPGHGSVSGDTHLSFVDGTKTHKEIELAPYENLIFKYNTSAVMVSHIFNEKYDDIYPASLSYNTVTGLLRRSMGYDGVVITDDLDMGAVKQNYDLEETVIQAINAGDDILLFSNRVRHNPNLPDDINMIVKSAITDGLIRPSKIQEAYDRVTAFKKAIIASEKK